MKKYNFVTTENGLRSTGTYNPNTFNALDAALAFIIFLVLEFGVDLLFGAGFKAYKATHEEYDYYLMMIIAVMLPQTLIFLIAFAFCKIRKVGFLHGGGFEFGFDAVNFLFAILLTLGIALVFYGVHMQFVDDVFGVFYDIDYQTYAERLNEQANGQPIFAFIYMYIITPIVPAIVEEGLFRGVIMRGMTQFGIVFTIFASSLCFTFMHGSPQQIILQFIFSCSLVSVVLLTKNFAIGCVMHFSNNLMIYVLAVIEENVSEAYAPAGYAVDALQILIGVAFLSVSIVYFINLLLAKNKRKILGQEEKTTQKDLDKYALIASDRFAEDGSRIYEKVVWNKLTTGGFEYAGREYSYKGAQGKINKRSHDALSKALIIAGIVLSVVMIFVYIFI